MISYFSIILAWPSSTHATWLEQGYHDPSSLYHLSARPISIESDFLVGQSSDWSVLNLAASGNVLATCPRLGLRSSRHFSDEIQHQPSRGQVC
ncbi:unnamed protein product [Protopolystoma xenopodis]|uniref:Secreted protein n=1 Tax=Protopolystoma xenopodis TaxID=117903 RepID=A0A448WM27_9PLAT|nr:unnamed protein product [Protopolystoma xenopodis]